MYNYLCDAMDIDFKSKTQYKICEETKSNCIIKATIFGKCYQDPDEVSKKLYKDMAEKFCNVLGNDVKIVRKRGQWYLELNDEHRLTTDYIGPSRKWALHYLNGDKDEKAMKIGGFLLSSRTIGGHVFWPVHKVEGKKTINQVKGDKAIFDRIDITLAELEHFYKTKFCGESMFYNPLFQSFKRYKWFFEKFKGGFPDYVEQMKLEDFLYEGKVISLTESDIEKGRIVELKSDLPYKPSNYEVYINNCINLIKKRTERISPKK